MERFVVIYNRSAGSAVEAARAAAVGRLRERAEVAEAVVERFDDIPGVLAAHPDHLPVAAGGDGTIHALVAALFARDDAARRPVGLIPLGTGNDLARTLDLPQDPAEAASVILDGADRWMDLVVDETGGVTVNVVHLGLGAEASRIARPLKSKLRRFAYAVGGLRAGAQSRGWHLRVEVDGKVVADGRRRVLMLGIGNGTSIGGGTLITPDARPDDGRVDVVVCWDDGLLGRIRYALLLRRGEHARHPGVLTLRGTRVSVQVRGTPVPVNADGDLTDPVESRTWRVVPHAWRIRTA